MKGRRASLRGRLTSSALLGAALMLATLVAVFNLLLGARLRNDADNVLRERAATVLRGLATVDGRLTPAEALDQGAVDAQTWIFAGDRLVEQPAHLDPRNELAARALARAGPGFTTVEATDTRLEGVPVSEGARHLGTVVVGTSLAPYQATATSALQGSVILGVLTLLAVALLARWLIGRALRPVALMTAEAADWSEHDRTQRFFTGEPHDELSTLASVFDALLERLALSLGRERRLTAEVSHELRTPLAKILAEAELATSRARSTEQYLASLRLIARHAEDLQRVLETLLAAARAQGPGVAAASDARRASERALQSLREGALAQGKSLELVCPGPARVAVEGEMLERILSPLLENAVRFARERVRLRIDARDGRVTLEITDDGLGVEESERAKIFEPGVRGAQAQGMPDGGAGLGLALARRLARSAGGEVEAVPDPRGGRFVVRLPAATQDAGPPPPAPAG